MSLVLDIVDEGVEYAKEPLSRQFTRSSLVYGLGAGAPMGDPSMVFRALVEAGLPSLFSTHESSPGLIATRQVVRPVADEAVRVLTYYTSGFVAPFGLFIVTDTTSLETVTTQLHPGTHEQLTLLFSDPNDGGNKLDDVATMTYRMPIRRMMIDAILVPGISAPSRSPSQANTPLLDSARFSGVVGSVNEKPWNGLGPGYWLCSQFNDRTADLGTSYNASVAFDTKTTEDWSQYAVLKNRNTGRYVRVNKRVLQEVVARPYQYDKFGGDADHPGIIKAGLQRMKDFGSIFGIGT